MPFGPSDTTRVLDLGFRVKILEYHSEAVRFGILLNRHRLVFERVLLMFSRAAHLLGRQG